MRVGACVSVYARRRGVRVGGYDSMPRTPDSGGCATLHRIPAASALGLLMIKVYVY